MNDPIKPNKRSRLARNSLYALLSWVLPAAPSLIVTPVIVRSIGLKDYGLYVALLGVTGYFFTTIVGKIAAKYVAKHRAAGDDALACKLFSATLVVSIIPTVVSLVVLFAGAHYFVSDVLRTDPALQQTATTGLRLAGVIILITAITQVWQSAIQGLQRFDTYLWVSNISSLLLSTGLLAIALSGGDVLNLLEWSAGSAFLTLVISAVSLKTLWPELKLTLHISSADWRRVSVYALSVMGSQFFGVAILLFERSLIIRKFGVESAAFYLVPMNVALLLLGFAGSVVAALFPALNEHLADARLVAELYRRAIKLVAIVVVFAIVVAAASGRTFLGLWLGPNFAESSSTLLVIHTITFSIMSLSLIWWQLAEAHGKAPATAGANFAVMIVTLPLMILLARSEGLIGVALGRLFGLTIYVSLLVYIERRFAGGFSPAFWLRLGSTLIFPSLISYALVCVWIGYLGVNWPAWASGVSIGAGVYFGTLYLIGAFDHAEIVMVKGLFLRKADARS